jgi:NADPH:quinone reductase-like Zn-dependent oxidoreductase
VQIAKHLGAKKVIATGRNQATLRAVAELGANVTIPLTDDEAGLEKAFQAQFTEGVGVVIDYLWGKSAERLLTAAAKGGAEGVPIRFVQIGSTSGADITLPSAVLRAAGIELMGSGIGSIGPQRMLGVFRDLFAAAPAAGFAVATHAVPLKDVATAWSADDSRRTVFTIEAKGG